MNIETKNWLDMVEYDIDTAKEMLRTGRYIYVIFMCHLSIEKALKAVVGVHTKKYPPKTHDLIVLLNRAEMEFPEEILDFIGAINNAAVVTRYPEDLSKLAASYPKEIAENYLQRTLEVLGWIKQDPRLKK